MARTTVSRKNIHKPAPRWFRKTKRAVYTLTVAANAMIPSWGISDPVLVTRLQLWCTTGIIAIMEALESILANGEEYTPAKPQEPVQ